MKLELTGGSVRIDDHTAVVAADTGEIRLAITAPHGEMPMPVYAARHYAEQILRACREAECFVDDEPRVPRREPAPGTALPSVTNPWV